MIIEPWTAFAESRHSGLRLLGFGQTYLVGRRGVDCPCPFYFPISANFSLLPSLGALVTTVSLSSVRVRLVLLSV